ncbi:MAG: hypothetical protein KC940_00870, partial [Candidatus Omnitrophica bacterium]|nr:hypothetical protein [Candidatus Omnitrophota bacterium]
MRVVTLVLTGITTLLVGGLEASPPPTINIQGSLAASDGSPITGTHAYRVTFLDAMVAPAQIGVVTGQVTLSESGRYSIVLEPPAGILETIVTFYELAIDTGDDGIDASDIFPNLVQLHSVPFALLAANADLLGGSPAS